MLTLHLPETALKDISMSINPRLIGNAYGLNQKSPLDTDEFCP